MGQSRRLAPRASFWWNVWGRGYPYGSRLGLVLESLGEYRLNDLSEDVGQPEVSPLVAVRQSLMIDSQ